MADFTFTVNLPASPGGVWKKAVWTKINTAVETVFPTGDTHSINLKSGDDVTIELFFQADVPWKCPYEHPGLTGNEGTKTIYGYPRWHYKFKVPATLENPMQINNTTNPRPGELKQI